MNPIQYIDLLFMYKWESITKHKVKSIKDIALQGVQRKVFFQFDYEIKINVDTY